MSTHVIRSGVVKSRYLKERREKKASYRGQSVSLERTGNHTDWPGRRGKEKEGRRNEPDWFEPVLTSRFYRFKALECLTFSLGIRQVSDYSSTDKMRLLAAFG